MSFKTFIYYCALLGGWGAFLAWLITVLGGVVTRDLGGSSVQSPILRTAVIAMLLAFWIAVAIGSLDALLNAVGLARIARVFVCAIVGVAGGFFGGLLGEALHQYAHFPSVIGWILVGVACGASIGVYDLLRSVMTGKSMKQALRKTYNGVLGGFLGGLIGGLPFTLLVDTQALESMYKALPLSSLAICLVLLGLFIGLLVGAAQVVLMEAWLKVEAGFRPGRELRLAKDETSIGRGEGCDLGLFGDSLVEKLHAKILLRDNRYLLADVGTPGGTYLNDQRVDKPAPLRSGDVIRVGKCVLRFGERQKRKR
jgi:hypothetical protein